MNITKEKFDELAEGIKIDKNSSAKRYLLRLIQKTNVTFMQRIEKIAFMMDHFGIYYKEGEEKKCIMLDYLGEDKDYNKVAKSFNDLI